MRHDKEAIAGHIDGSFFFSQIYFIEVRFVKFAKTKDTTRVR